MTAPLLETRNLTVTVGEHTVTRGLSLTLDRGERLAILGRNGAGKSTLLATLAGLRPPAAGEVRLAGRPYPDLSAREAALTRGWLAQAAPDPFATTVLETALTGRHPHLGRWEWESAADADLARAALARVGLAGFEARQVATLSGGERQRLGLATLLTQAPSLYLLDEPLAHLDLNHQIASLELLARQAEAGAATVLVLHEPGLAARYCDRALLVFGDGSVEQGPCDEVLTAPTLTRLYGHPMKELADGSSRWFVPA